MLPVSFQPAMFRCRTLTLALCAFALGGSAAAGDALPGAPGEPAEAASSAATEQPESSAKPGNQVELGNQEEPGAQEEPEKGAGKGAAAVRFGEKLRDRASLIHPVPHLALPQQHSAAAVERRACALSAAAFERRQVTLSVLGELYSLSRRNRHRRSPEIWGVCAESAEILHCPDSITATLRRLADPELPSHLHRRLLQQLDRACERERLNALALRQYIELLPEEYLDLPETIDLLPLGTLFLRTELPVDGRPLSPDRPSLPTADDLCAAAQQALGALKHADDRDSADAAARALMPLLLLRASLPQGAEGEPRCSAPAEIAAFRQAENLTRELRRLLHRAAGQQYFGSPSLAAASCLLDVL